MLTTDVTTVKASRIKGKWLKWKALPHFLQPQIIDMFDPVNLRGYHEGETLKHFRDCDEKTYSRVMHFYYDYVQGWTDTRGGTLTIENSIKYIKANLGLE